MNGVYTHQCFFCKRNLMSPDIEASYCAQCTESYNMNSVNIFYDVEGIKTIGYTLKFEIDDGRHYDIHGNLLVPKTIIYTYDKDDVFVEAIILPGTPFNLQNVRKKLPIYLLFS